MSGGDATGRAERATWRRQRLLDAALEVFGRKGVDGATIKDVASAAGVAPGLLYHYFDGKEALVLALIAEQGFLPELRRMLAVGVDRPAAEVLPELVGSFGRLLAERGDLVALFFSGASSRPGMRAELHGLVAEGQCLLGSYLTARVAAGELRDHDTLASAQMLLSSVVLGQVTGQPADPAGVVDVLLGGLRPHRNPHEEEVTGP